MPKTAARYLFFCLLPGLLWLPLTVGAASALPPRTVGDVLALLRAAPVQRAELAAAETDLAAAIPAAASGRELAEAHLQRARAAELLGLTDRSLSHYRAAWQAAGRPLDPAYVQLRTEYGAAELHAGNMLAGMSVFEETATRGTLGGIRLSSHALLADYKARHGDKAGAEGHLRQAESEFWSVQRAPVYGIWGYAWEASVERARAGVAYGLGKYAVAENHFRKAAHLRERDLERNLFRLDTKVETPSQKIAVAHVLVNWKGVADALLYQGRLVEAELVYRDTIARASREFGTASPLTQLHLDGLAQVLLEQGRSGDARDLAATVLDILQQQGVAPESRTLTATRLRLAAAHVARRQWPEALAQYKAIDQVLGRDTELRRRLGRGDTAWALTLLRTGQPAAALRMMETLLAEDVGRFTDDDARLAETRGFHAMALAGAGQPAAALAQFRRALPALLAARRDSGDEGLTAASQRQVIILEAYLDLLERLHRERQAPADFDAVGEAFRIADVARASGVQRALVASAARAAVHDPELAALVRDEQDLSNRIGALAGALARLVSAPPEQRLDRIVADIRRDIPRLKAERLQLRERIAAVFPAYEQLINPKPPFPADVQALLGSGEAMLAVYVGELRTYVWAIARNGPAHLTTTTLPPAAIRERVDRIRQSLEPKGAAASGLGFDLAGAHELYTQIVAPAAPIIADAHSLLVVTHGPLGQLPFSLLPRRAEKAASEAVPLAAYSAVPWLVRDYAITQLPSASTLAALRRQDVAGPPAQAPFLGFGDPLFGRQPPAAAAPSSGRGIARRAQVATRASASASLADLAPLPDTGTEIAEMAAALGADAGESIRLGAAATETAVKASDLSRYRVVAFATHGLTPGDLDGLVQPALALANPQLTGEQDADGLLTMDEILGLKMRSDWVVLSACNTAAADGNSGEALSGLGRAFFYAGTRAVLATHWPVETVSARLLTTELFRRQTAEPALSRAQALRAAMLAMMDRHAVDERSGRPSFSYAHPLFWAPFALVGDGSAR